MPIAAPTALAASPNHGRRRALFSVATTIAAGATNGSSITKNGRGSLIGPSHHVASPSSRLAFHTPVKATNTMTHVAPVTRRQPGVSCPAPRARRAAAAPASAARWRRRGRGVDVATGAHCTCGAGAARARGGRPPLPSCGVTSGGGRVLSIFFPMWNEEDYVERAVDAARRVCDPMVADGQIADYELIIVDDASTDRTPEMADALAAADRRVRVVHHERNRKLGGAIKTGFATARGDLILYSDADLPFDMDEMPRAVRLLREYDVDIVSAYRFDRTGEGYMRAIYTFFYNVLIRTMFGVKARDINFAFKLCRRRVFDHIELRSEGSFIDAELIIRATRMGFDILQFGVDYFPRTRGESTLSSPGIIVTILREMATLRGELKRLQPVGHRALNVATGGAPSGRPPVAWRTDRASPLP